MKSRWLRSEIYKLLTEKGMAIPPAQIRQIVGFMQGKINEVRKFERDRCAAIFRENIWKVKSPKDVDRIEKAILNPLTEEK